MRPTSSTRCRAEECRAPIFWASTAANGKPIPLDFEPRPDGNIVLELRGRELTAITLGPIELALLEPDVERFYPHHGTCPAAADFR